MQTACRALPSIVLFLLCGSFAHAEPRPSGQWTIPSGQERVVAAMFGGADGIAGCTFNEVAIDHDVIDATFRCASPGTSVRVHLEYKGDGACRATGCTEKFAITVADPSAAPAGFTSALRARVAREEPAFRWTQPMIDGPGRGGGTSGVMRFVRTYAAFVGAVVVLAIVVLALVVRKRRTRSVTPPNDAPR